MNHKPELLLPAGSPEAFTAALQGGADAVYLGLQNFNARGRAKNFQINHLPALIQKAAASKAKVYLTLNTLIKNNELVRLLEYLSILQQYPPAAIIIQDWGVYYLLRKHFPQIPIHTSTQMGNHNSMDCRYAELLRFERVILARELSLEELSSISTNSSIELEIFAHGALCYSFSGSCLFSSWIGGMSANRGQCRQPCRHQFQTTGKEAERYFSMKDFELIEYLPQIAKLGIKAVKIEGRMRPADYVYTVAKAYRLALDHPERIADAKQLLTEDGGRDKTQWFIPGQSAYATTGNSFTGKGIGSVISNKDGYIGLQLIDSLQTGAYIRFQTDSDLDSEATQVNKLYLLINEKYKPVSSADSGQIAYISALAHQIPLKSIVYQTRHISSSKWSFQPASTNIPTPDKQKINRMLSDLTATVKSEKLPANPEIYLRISDPAWIDIIRQNADSKASAKSLTVLFPIHQDITPQKGLNLIPEIPFFTSEADLPALQQKVRECVNKGYYRFCLSRLSQTLLFKGIKGIELLTNEQVYALNDAALAHLKQSGIKQWILPLENDFPNLISSRNREGIIPLYFHPGLFYSRQPVFDKDRLELTHGKEKLLYLKDNDMYRILSRQAVCNFTFYPRLMEKGYRRFLIDLSNEKPDAKTLHTVLTAFQNGKNLEGTSRFNMKQGLW